jgi:hypothetical protein
VRLPLISGTDYNEEHRLTLDLNQSHQLRSANMKTVWYPKIDTPSHACFEKLKQSACNGTILDQEQQVAELEAIVVTRNIRVAYCNFLFLNLLPASSRQQRSMQLSTKVCLSLSRKSYSHSRKIPSKSVE